MTERRYAPMGPVALRALAGQLYPWHRRQKEMWELAAAVDAALCKQIVMQARDRRPSRRNKPIWTPRP